MSEACFRAHPCESAYKKQFINSPLHGRAKSTQTTWRRQNSVARWRYMNSETFRQERQEAETRTGSRVTPLLGRDELNLIDFPIGTLSYKQPKNDDGSRPDELVFAVETFDQQRGKVIPKKLTTRTSSKYGFPTPKEEQLLVGLLLLTRMKNNFSQPRVEFRSGELFALMNWPHNSSSKRQLQTGLDRLSGVKLQYENSWSTDAGQKFEKVFHTGILDSYQLTTQTSGTPRNGSESNWIQWSSEVFADIRSGNVKELNTEEFFSLKYPLARRMYRFLDRQLSLQPHFEMDLLAFAGHLGIAETEHIGKIKERLVEPIAELETLPSFIVQMPNDERYTKLQPGCWNIRFDRASEQPQMAERPRYPGNKWPKKSSPENDAGTQLVQSFYKGWSNLDDHQPTHRELKQAEDLISRYSADNLATALPVVFRQMKRHFPQARAFGASLLFWPEAVKAPKAAASSADVPSKPDSPAILESPSEAEKRHHQAERKRRLREQWKSLTTEQQTSIRATVYEHAETFVRLRIEQHRYNDPLVELACLDELERQSQKPTQQSL